MCRMELISYWLYMQVVRCFPNELNTIRVQDLISTVTQQYVTTQ
jgi:hypothetical protein